MTDLESLQRADGGWSRGIIGFSSAEGHALHPPKGTTSGTARSFSMKTFPLGTAYTVWTGIGAVGAFVVGVVMLGEPLTIGRVLAAALIVAGLSVMKLTAPA
jgi:hypothetical protein